MCSSDLVVKDATGGPPKTGAGQTADARSGDLMETCLFSLTPAQGPTQ